MLFPRESVLMQDLLVLTMHASLIMGLFSGQTLLTVSFHLKFPRAEMLLLHRACGEMNADFE